MVFYSAGWLFATLVIVYSQFFSEKAGCEYTVLLTLNGAEIHLAFSLTAAGPISVSFQYILIVFLNVVCS